MRKRGDRMYKVPRVSVVIATYNRSGLLRETVDSILSQAFQDFELIVVDDGSTDDTSDVLAFYKNRIQYIRQENRGPSAARNLGVRHSKAEWISFLDSDDLCLPQHLQTLYGYVQAHPDCGMVFANGKYLGGPEHNRDAIIPKAKSRSLAEGGVQLGDLFDKSIVRLQAALLSRRVYDEIGGHDESLRVCMDLDLSFRLAIRGAVAYIDEAVFLYRKHEGNIGKNEELRLTENIRVIQKLLNDYPAARKILGASRVRKRLAYRYYRLAKGRWKRNQRGAAREAIRQAVLLRPFALKYRVHQLQWNSIR